MLFQELHETPEAARAIPGRGLFVQRRLLSVEPDNDKRDGNVDGRVRSTTSPITSGNAKVAIPPPECMVRKKRITTVIHVVKEVRIVRGRV